MALVERQCTAVHPMALRLAQHPALEPSHRARLASFAVAHCPDESLLDALRIATEGVQRVGVVGRDVSAATVTHWLSRCVNADAAPGLPSCGLGALALGAALALSPAALESVCSGEANTPRMLLVTSVAASLMAVDEPAPPTTPPPVLWAAAQHAENDSAAVARRLCGRLHALRHAQATSARIGAAVSAAERARHAGVRAAEGDGDALAVLQVPPQHEEGPWSDMHWAFLEALLPALPAGAVPQAAKDGVNAAVGTLSQLDAPRLHRQLLQQIMPRMDGTDAVHVLLLLRSLKHCAEGGGGVYDALVEFVKRVRSVGGVNFKVLLQPVLLGTADEVRGFWIWIHWWCLFVCLVLVIGWMLLTLCVHLVAESIEKTTTRKQQGFFLSPRIRACDTFDYTYHK